jgi:hypothetical protein
MPSAGSMVIANKLCHYSTLCSLAMLWLVFLSLLVKTSGSVSDDTVHLSILFDAAFETLFLCYAYFHAPLYKV